MSNVRVAADAGEGFVRRGHRLDVVHNLLVTFAAGAFGGAPAAFFYLDWLMKFVCRERQRVEEAVISFREVLGHKASRCMAIVAGGDGAMTRFDPAVEVVLHDVAVGAGPGIVAQIRAAFRIDKRVTADACRRSDAQGNHHCQQHRRLARRRGQFD